MKRILYIESNTDGTVGGSYYSLLDLIRGLDKSRFEPWVVFFREHELLPEFRAVTPHVHVLPSRLRYRSRQGRAARHLQLLWDDLVGRYLQMRELIGTMQPDLVHLNNAYSNIDGWTLACRRHRVKIVSHDRGTDCPCSLRTRFFAGFLDAIISVSDSFRDNVISQRLATTRAHRVYNGLDLDAVLAACSPAGVARLRDELGLSGLAPVIGIVGDLDRANGYQVVLEALRRVAALHPDLRCLLVGGAGKDAEWHRQAQATRLPDDGPAVNVVSTGSRGYQTALLGVIDVLVQVSIKHERVIMEAMAMAKPIVGTEVGEIPELISHRESGLLVPLGDAQALSEAILYYLADPARARSIGERGRQRLRERFSVERMVRETEEIYRALLLA